MFGIGDQEFFLIILFAFLLFGPDKLPGMGRTIGRVLRQFRTAQEGVSKVVQSEIIDPINNDPDTPSSKAAAQAAKEDEDLSEEQVAAARPAETFAERRARLAAEKAAGAPSSSPPGPAAPDTVPAADASADASDATVPADASTPKPAPTSAAALYGLDDDEEDA